VTRVLSALVLASVLLVTIWWAPWWATLGVAALIALLAGDELVGLGARLGAAPVPPGFAGLAAALACVAFALTDPASPAARPGVFAGSIVAIVLAIGFVMLATGPPAPGTLTAAGTVALAPLYVGVPLGAVASIRGADGAAALTWLVVVIATSDSAQYYTGRAFGRRKLSPAVSPGKTVEGALGGLAAAAVAGAIASIWLLPSSAPAVAGALGLVLAATGICGDLFESMLKRSAGAKDSSHLIPGHGGMLDRIDSYLFAGPLFYLYLRYLA
jgi:phosphatidate cytidylyltransferase